MKPQVICVPGGVAPAAQRYRPLIEAVGDAADLHLKDLEVYSDARPPADYSIEMELQAIDRLAGSNNLQRFHLVGYSGGGFVSLAYAGTRPERLESLALFEAASIPGTLTEAEQRESATFRARLSGLEGPEFMSAFVRAQLKPGVPPPPPPSGGPPSPEMQKRPAGIAALMKAFEAFQLDRGRFADARFPVFIAYGDQTHEIEATRAGVLAQLFADIHVRRYTGVHHFVAPEMIYTPEHARTLIDLWRNAQSSAS